MANPRTGVSFEEIGAHRSTYIGSGAPLAYDRDLAYGTASRGLAVCMGAAANTVVVTAGATKGIIGAVDHVEPDGKVVVHDAGYIRFAGTGGTLGLPIVGAAAGATVASTVNVGFGEVVEVGADFIVVKKIG
jgi:hypothetical protein